MIKENHTDMLAQLLLNMLDTATEKGTCKTIPKNAQKPNILSGTETRYSWKKADITKTTDMTTILEYPLLSKGT